RTPRPRRSRPASGGSSRSTTIRTTATMTSTRSSRAAGARSTSAAAPRSTWSRRARATSSRSDAARALILALAAEGAAVHAEVDPAHPGVALEDAGADRDAGGEPWAEPQLAARTRFGGGAERGDARGLRAVVIGAAEVVRDRAQPAGELDAEAAEAG